MFHFFRFIFQAFKFNDRKILKNSFDQKKLRLPSEVNSLIYFHRLYSRVSASDSDGRVEETKAEIS